MHVRYVFVKHLNRTGPGAGVGANDAAGGGAAADVTRLVATTAARATPATGATVRPEEAAGMGIGMGMGMDTVLRRRATKVPTGGSMVVVVAAAAAAVVGTGKSRTRRRRGTTAVVKAIR